MKRDPYRDRRTGMNNVDAILEDARREAGYFDRHEEDEEDE